MPSCRGPSPKGVLEFTWFAINNDDPSFDFRACDAEDIDVVHYCPGADGQPDFANPIVVSTNLSLPAQPPGACRPSTNPLADFGPLQLTAIAFSNDRQITSYADTVIGESDSIQPLRKRSVPRARFRDAGRRTPEPLKLQFGRRHHAAARAITLASRPWRVGVVQHGGLQSR
jgi:hypothetical protein